jgi:hypothetical protein
MSALAPIATNLAWRRSMSLRAISRREQAQQLVRAGAIEHLIDDPVEPKSLE